MKFILVKDINTGKKKYLHIFYGYKCSSSCFCIHGRKCRYRSTYLLHNFSVKFRLFFEYKLHIKLPYFPIHFSKNWVDLSGTEKCPHNMSRLMTCHECKHCGDPLTKECNHPERPNKSIDELKVRDYQWGNHHRCSLFEKNEWADNYDRKTGEML